MVLRPYSWGLNIPAGHKMSFKTGEKGKLKYRFMEAGKRDSTYNNFVGDLTVGLRAISPPPGIMI